MKCPNCGAKLEKAIGLLGLKGIWECPNCLKDPMKQCRFDILKLQRKELEDGL